MFLDTDTWLPLLQVVALDPEIKNSMGNYCRLAFGIENHFVFKYNNPPSTLSKWLNMPCHIARPII
jgi:hypothetical protein